MAVTEKPSEVSFGATVTCPMNPQGPQHPPPLLIRNSQSFEKSPLTPIPSESESTSNTPKISHEGGGNSNPYSAFYNHDLCSTSSNTDKDKLNNKLYLDVCRPSADLESGTGGTPISATSTIQPCRYSVDGRLKECTMWPSKQTLMDAEKKRKREQAARRCVVARSPLRNLPKKQRLIVKITIALFVVAAAVGLGIGISKAVGGGVWAGRGQSKEIGVPS